MKLSVVPVLLLALAFLPSCKGPKATPSKANKTTTPQSKAPASQKPAAKKAVTKPESVPPFVLRFGRGSGWRGLNSVYLTEKGAVRLVRMVTISKKKTTSIAWQTATLQLNKEQVRQVYQALYAKPMLALKSKYDGKTHDGTQWILLTSSKGQQRVNYFDNLFPAEIKSFSKTIDAILDSAGRKTASWKPLKGARKGNVDAAIMWKAIRPKKK